MGRGGGEERRLQQVDWIYHGFLLRIHDQRQCPSQACSSCYQSYVERDLRQIANLEHFVQFEKFVKRFAGCAHGVQRRVGRAEA